MLERLIESIVFYSRWLLAPMFVGLALGLVFLVVSFISEIVHFLSTDGMFNSKDSVLFILELIDLTLIGSLVAMVAIAGYENFVSKIDFKSDLERPEWMGKVDFAGLKLKVISALVAISSIELLKVFLNSGSYEEGEIMWRVIIHSVFVASGFIFALTEKFMPHK
ncbi:MAG: TIGR00645 family protein [Arenicellales bacterium]|jgi:uncharacterized protein (TIGR00645 family)|nr:TIGR00645 family protein [Arenicellales bacterium]